jgi:hypothetical protein
LRKRANVFENHEPGAYPAGTWTPPAAQLRIARFAGASIQRYEAAAELVASLERESARVKNGEYTLFEREAFLDELRNGYKDYQRSSELFPAVFGRSLCT